MGQENENPLFLTELIKFGQLDRARELAKVGKLSETTYESRKRKLLWIHYRGSREKLEFMVLVFSCNCEHKWINS